MLLDIEPPSESSSSVGDQSMEAAEPSPDHSAPQHGTKRKRSSASDSSQPTPKRHRQKHTPPPIIDAPVAPSPRISVANVVEPSATLDDALSSYALEAFSALGNRRHAFGIQALGTKVLVKYFDRSGCITLDSPLDLCNDEGSDIKQFISLIIGLSLCTLVQLGLEPYLAQEPPYLQAPPAPPNSLIPAPSSSFGSITNYTIASQERGDCYQKHFILTSLLHSSRSLYGRGTVVYAARPHPENNNGDGIAIPDEVIVKLSWQYTSADTEEDMFAIASKRGVKGLANMYAGAIGGWLSNGIRQVILRGRLDGYRDRELRVQFMGPLCVPWYSLTNLDDFKSAFISLVKGELDVGIILSLN